MSLFALSFLGNALAGWLNHNVEEMEQGRAESTFTQYLMSGEFAESVFENWESEFLQMGVFVIFAAVLRQRGSAVTREAEGRSPQPAHRSLSLKLYSHSLTFALFALFLLSFVGHALSGKVARNEELRRLGFQPESFFGYLGTSRFWFESFQNWQSEFFSVAMLVILSVFLKESRSPESNP